jgi:two-component system response regulator AtoC
MVRVDVRVIASTNRDLFKSINEGTFREDLFYRLNVYPIRIPPLRDRKEDIPEIADVYLRKLSARNGGRGAGSISPEALRILISYDWPGNVRELQNVIEQSAISAKGVVLPEDLPSSIATADSGEDAIHKYQFNLKAIVQDVERQTIIRALNHCNWNKSAAADLLGLGRRTLYDKMRDLGIGEE